MLSENKTTKKQHCRLSLSIHYSVIKAQLKVTQAITAAANPHGAERSEVSPWNSSSAGKESWDISWQQVPIVKTAKMQLKWHCHVTDRRVACHLFRFLFFFFIIICKVNKNPLVGNKRERCFIWKKVRKANGSRIVAHQLQEILQAEQSIRARVTIITSYQASLPRKHGCRIYVAQAAEPVK